MLFESVALFEANTIAAVKSAVTEKKYVRDMKFFAARRTYAPIVSTGEAHRKRMEKMKRTL